jgi:hypothetical protein
MNTNCFALLFLVSMLFAANNAYSAISLAFNPLSQSQDSLEIGIVISGLSANTSPSLSTYDLDVHFDDSHLSFENAVFGDPQLGNQLDLQDFGANLSSAELIRPGLLNLYELSFDSVSDLNDLQADSFTLAVLTFAFLSEQTSNLEMTINTLGDANGDALSADGASSPVAPVPLPSALWLMGSVLAVAYRKTNKQKLFSHR